MNIRLGFVAISRKLIVLFPTNKMSVVTNVTKIVIEKHCDKVLLRSHMLTVLNPLKISLIEKVFFELITVKHACKISKSTLNVCLCTFNLSQGNNAVVTLL